MKASDFEAKNEISGNGVLKNWKTEELSELKAVVWFSSEKIQRKEQNQCFSFRKTSKAEVLSIENLMDEIRLAVRKKQRLYLVMN